MEMQNLFEIDWTQHTLCNLPKICFSRNSSEKAKTMIKNRVALKTAVNAYTSENKFGFYLTYWRTFHLLRVCKFNRYKSHLAISFAQYLEIPFLITIQIIHAFG